MSFFISIFIKNIFSSRRNLDDKIEIVVLNIEKRRRFLKFWNRKQWNPRGATGLGIASIGWVIHADNWLCWRCVGRGCYASASSSFSCHYFLWSTHFRDHPEAENQHEILLQDVPDGGRRIEDQCLLPVEGEGGLVTISPDRLSTSWFQWASRRLLCDGTAPKKWSQLKPKL